MSDDIKVPPGDNTFFPMVPDNLFSVLPPRRMTDELYHLYSHYRPDNIIIDIFIDAQNNLRGATSFTQYAPEDLRNQTNWANKDDAPDIRHYYVGRFHIDLPFEEALGELPPNIRDFKTTQELKASLIQRQALESMVLEEDDCKPNLPPLIISQDGSAPRLAGHHSKKQNDNFLNQCDKAGISLIFDGARQGPYEKPAVRHLSVAVRDNQRTADFTHFSGIPRELIKTSISFSEFLQSDNEIFVASHSKIFGDQRQFFYKNPQVAAKGIEMTNRAGLYHSFMVLDRQSSFQEQIKGRFISIEHAMKNPIITSFMMQQPEPKPLTYTKPICW